MVSPYNIVARVPNTEHKYRFVVTIREATMKTTMMLIAMLCVYTYSIGCYSYSPPYAQSRYVERNGIVWFVHDYRLYKYNRITGEVINASKGDSITTESVGNELMQRWTSQTTPLIPSSIVSLGFDAQGRLWMANEYFSISMFDGIDWKTYSLPEPTNYHPLVDSRDYVGSVQSARFLDTIFRLGSYYKIVDFDIATQTFSIKPRLGKDLYGWNGVSDDGSMNINARYFTAQVDLNHQQYFLGDVAPDAPQYWRDHHARLKFQLDSGGFQSTSKSTNTDQTIQTLVEATKPKADTRNGREYFNQRYPHGELVFDVAIGQNNVVYVATSEGVIVLPDNSITKTNEDKTKSFSMSVFPNPTQTDATVTIETGLVDPSLMIVNSAGSVVQNRRITSGTVPIDMQHEPAGVYTVIVTTKTSRSAKQLVVVK